LLPHPRQHLLLLFEWLTGVRWNLNVILIFISLGPKMFSVFSCICWPFVLLLLRIVCSVHLTAYSVGCWFFVWLFFFELLVYADY
jgi:hypothetical protein